MPKITVGVPIYNAEAFMEECLGCLEGQTFKDFEVLIFDNASTDRTGAICEAYARRDARFKHTRQPVNKGPTQNFLDALGASQSPYFLWRAHDDLTSVNFLEVMHGLFAARPNTLLAVSAVEKVKLGGAKRRLRRVVDLNSGPEPIRLARVLLKSEASWFYGLWHRETLVREFAAVWALYPFGWGSDHLTLLRVLIENAVTGSNDAVFSQRFVGRPPTSEDTVERAITRATADEMQHLRDRFSAAFRLRLEGLDLTRTQRYSLAALLPLYLAKRVHSSSRIARTRVFEGLRRTGPLSPSTRK